MAPPASQALATTVTPSTTVPLRSGLGLGPPDPAHAKGTRSRKLSKSSRTIAQVRLRRKPSFMAKVIAQQRGGALEKRYRLAKSVKTAHSAHNFSVLSADGARLKCTLLFAHHAKASNLHGAPRPVVVIRSGYYRKNLDTRAMAWMLSDRGIHVLCSDIRGRFASEQGPH